MKLISPAFSDGTPMPARYTADGDNHSPPLVFSEIPSAARTLALTMEDHDANPGPFVHWIIFEIDPKITGLALAEIAGRYRDGVNSFRELGYTGPHARELHRYQFRLYALETLLGLPNGLDLRQLTQSMAGHVLAVAELMATYHCTGGLPSHPLGRTKAPLASG